MNNQKYHFPFSVYEYSTTIFCSSTADLTERMEGDETSKTVSDSDPAGSVVALICFLMYKVIECQCQI